MAAPHRRWYDRRHLSDIIIHIGDELIYGHKLILAGKSRYFERAFDLGGSLHDEDRLIFPTGLGRKSPGSISFMIKHLYGIYEDVEDVEQNIELYALAKEYRIPSLANHVVRFMRARLEQSVDDPVAFTHALDMVYSQDLNAAHRIRKMVGKVCANHYVALVLSEDFAQLIIAYPDLSYDMNLAFMVNRGGARARALLAPIADQV